MSNPIVRTPEGQYFQGKINMAWGGYWAPTDPVDEEVMVVDSSELEGFELVPNFPKIPAELWTAIINLYRATCKGAVDGCLNQETSVRLLRSESDPSQWKVVVPRQVVTGASVRAEDFNDCVDLITGEEYQQYPPAGWVNAGSSHSHDQIPAFFSSTDDHYELSDPGIHIVVGSFNVDAGTHVPLASIVQMYRRYIVPVRDVVDTTEVEGVTFHPNVLNYISAKNYDSYYKQTVSRLNALLDR